MTNLLDMMETTEDRQALAFCIELPMPPTDNMCHASMANGKRYPTPTFRQWLKDAGKMLRDKLGDQTPDPLRWWSVDIHLWLEGTRSDGQNYLKPLIDLLSGAQIQKYKTLAGNASERIIKPGGLWKDDKRVRFLYLSVEAINCGEKAKAMIEATPVPEVEKWVKERAPRKKKGVER